MSCRYVLEGTVMTAVVIEFGTRLEVWVVPPEGRMGSLGVLRMWVARRW